MNCYDDWTGLVFIALKLLGAGIIGWIIGRADRYEREHKD